MLKSAENLLRVSLIMAILIAVKSDESTPIPSSSPVIPETTTTTADVSTTTPATTTSPATTTVTPTPTPAPVHPGIVNWTWTDEKTHITCILVEMALQLNFTYENKDNATHFTTYNIPVDSKVFAGDCQNTSQHIAVKFGHSDMDSMLTLYFGMNTTTNYYNLTDINFKLNVSDLIPDAKANQIKELEFHGPAFITPPKMSYHCNKQQKLNLTSNIPNENAYLFVSKVQLEAFHTTPKAVYSYSKDCEAIDTPDIVPIAVGCALVALIVIVLIAYLVGRRRSQARGYLSM